ncbi:alpha/beta hydrolase family protein [Acuticoccus sp. MNP-M23]|uniref:alpha/beta hydrolase family protein n=1 Tax=Acuticoccus sp. MNP-M23 TaxID=3072793 RepID=UPI0035C24B4D
MSAKRQRNSPLNVWIKLAASISCALVPLIAADSADAGRDLAGVRELAVPSAERGDDLAVTVWYPAEAGGTPVTLGESIFFRGTSAMKDAPVSKGPFPLILLSHGAGLGGTPQAMSWLATPLAKAGYVVAAPTHPGNGGRVRSALDTVKLWLRPADITATLDAMAASTVFKDSLEPGNIGVLGLSMGGSTALSLAGARIDPALLAGYCDTFERNASLCGWIKASGVDLHAIDMSLAGRDNTDDRIGFAMAIDPAPVDVLEQVSFSQITIPTEIVNLGREGEIPVSTLSSGIARQIANGRYATVADASHYSMFGECKPGAAGIAESEDIGEPICTDGTGDSRRDIHAQLIRIVIAAFDKALKGGN